MKIFIMLQIIPADKPSGTSLLFSSMLFEEPLNSPELNGVGRANGISIPGS